MIFQFWQKHANKNLIKQSLFQAFLFLSVFFLFFSSLGFYVYYSMLWAVMIYLAIAVLYRMLNLPFFIFPSISGPVYLPSSHQNVERMIELAQVKKGERAIDIGAGDGRLVIALAKAGADALGVELNPSMVEVAEASIAASGVQHARVEWQDFWNVDFSKYDVVTLYGFPSTLKDLEKKLQLELKPGARIVANHYPLPTWPEEHKKGDVYLYVQKKV